MIRIRIGDPRSLGSWRIKGTDESTPGKDLSVPLMHGDLSDLGHISDPDPAHEWRILIGFFRMIKIDIAKRYGIGMQTNISIRLLRFALIAFRC